MEQTPRGDPKTRGKRYSVTLRGVYVEHLDRLASQGVYLDEQDAIRSGLRLLFDHHGVELYVVKAGTSP